MWTYFKTAVAAAVERPKCRVPAKLIPGLTHNSVVQWEGSKEPIGVPRRRWSNLIRSDTGSYRRKYKDRPVPLNATMYRKIISEDLKQNPKRLWGYMKSKRKVSEGVSPLLNSDGFLQSDSQQKANILNDQFQSVYTRKNTEGIPDMGPSTPPDMNHITIHPPGIIKLLKELNIHKASGPDSIPTFILQKAASEIASVLSKICQTSADTGDVPSDWRETHIVPIYKKGDKQLASNYRPVSLTSVTCKILEHIMHSNIMKHLIFKISGRRRRRRIK